MLQTMLERIVSQISKQFVDNFCSLIAQQEANLRNKTPRERKKENERTRERERARAKEQEQATRPNCMSYCLVCACLYTVRLIVVMAGAVRAYKIIDG